MYILYEMLGYAAGDISVQVDVHHLKKICTHQSNK